MLLPTNTLSLDLLGPFEIRLNGAPLDSFEYNKVRALLAYLVVEAHQAHSRLSLCALLWPDLPESAARQNLSQALSQLRKVLREKEAAVPFLITTPDRVQINPGAAWETDLARFHSLLDAAEAHRHRAWHLCAPCQEKLDQAAGLYRGDFLSQFYLSDSSPFEDWALHHRERLRQRMLSALERRAQFFEWRGDFHQAAEIARRQVQLEPVNDRSQRQLLRLLALSGQPAAALAQYDYWQRLSAAEFGLEPEPETLALVQQIRAWQDQPGGEPDAGWRRLQAPANRLPVPLTRLVGREKDLGAIQAAWESGCRLLTLSGPPGVGKTRLALEAAHRHHLDFEHGARFVELASLAQAGHLPLALAQCFDLKEKNDQPIQATLAAFLRDQHLLLVLDNFEHLPAAAPFVASLLAECPDLTLLVTSRVPLRIPGEQQQVLSPLDPDQAVQLFTQRAQAARADFRFTPEEAGTIAGICQRLDNLPLGIELVAVRARMFTPAELFQQLQKRLEVGAGANRAGWPGRHNTLRQAIAWSYDRLSPAGQAALAQLAVFAGSFRLEAAEEVIGPVRGEPDPAPLDGLPALEVLVEASLVIPQAAQDETRFLLLETIREFALEQLHSLGPSAAPVWRRYTDYYARLAAAANTELIGPQGARWLALITAEQDNIRLAFQTSLAQGWYETALQIATGVWRFHWMRGMLREGLERLEAALALCPNAPAGLLSGAMRAAGTLAIGLSDYPRAVRWLEGAIAAALHLPDKSLVQAGFTNLGFALFEQGEFEAARRCLEESLALARQAENTHNTKFPLSMLGSLHTRLGNLPQARACFEESIHINRAYQDSEGTADALRGLAKVVTLQGDPAAARRLAEEALALHAALDHQLGTGQDYATLGDIASDLGEYPAALGYYRQCLAHWAGRENVVNRAAVYEAAAVLFQRLGDPQNAVKFLSAAAEIRAQARVRLTAYEQSAWDFLTGRCRAALGESAYAQNWDTGRRLAPDELDGLLASGG